VPPDSLVVDSAPDPPDSVVDSISPVVVDSAPSVVALSEAVVVFSLDTSPMFSIAVPSSPLDCGLMSRPTSYCPSESALATLSTTTTTSSPASAGSALIEPFDAAAAEAAKAIAPNTAIPTTKAAMLILDTV
jgi:hypothetical protein